MKFKEITLRAVEPEDLELLYEWENNNKYWILSNTATPFSRYTLKRYIEISHKSIFETGQLRLMIVHEKSRITVGSIDIFDFDPFHRRAGLGIMIAREDFRRKGLASMALECIKDYCFSTLQLHQLYCNILENNRESMSLFKKAGFKEAGIKKGWVKSGDKFLDEHIFQLLRSEDSV